MQYLRILIVSALLTPLVIYATILTLIPLPIAAEYWVREMITIKLDIAEKYSDRRKVVFAAGSSTLFGVSGSRMSEALCVPVINLGLHAGLPLEEILSVADKAVRSGDILILPLEVPKYAELESISDGRIRDIIAWQPEVWKGFSLKKKFESINVIGPMIVFELIKTKVLLLVNPQSLRRRLDALDNKAILGRFNPNIEPSAFEYSAYHLSDHGDMKKNEGILFRVGGGYSPEQDIVISNRVHDILLAFTKKMNHRGVMVYFANMPYLKGHEFNLDRVKQSSENFRHALSDIGPLIDNKQDLIFDRNLFFNTIYHLNSAGRKKNTGRLVKVVGRLLDDAQIMNCAH
ncbi:MAG: hypothetical protein Q9M23_07815 [Mariprofundaceae bacterium]|nr:hypothetical protein [Mariprofundaceae bacterium]